MLASEMFAFNDKISPSVLMLAVPGDFSGEMVHQPVFVLNKHL